ncbi:MAG TPA: NUDIX hydrolase [Methanospirillum sp.]|uniref:NUDIX hydrolase n=1 Tax=Methanospirillum sp. TaxID=45200 RepID=UPI002C3118F1|nr:NUDIX hydrolase [Methanospirillum sp.]HWQ63740.1 NUDIX hydrolase [Methanospirillum sp.]
MEIYRGRRLIVEKSIFSLPNGMEREAVVVRPSGAVVIFPIDGEYCYLIRQWRFAIDQFILEAPAGTMEAGEDPVETARRELIEEAGLAARELIPRGFIYTTPGFTDERIFIYEARGLTPSREYAPDADEIIEPVRLKTSDVCRMVRDGEIVDAKTIAAVARCIGKVCI